MLERMKKEDVRQQKERRNKVDFIATTLANNNSKNSTECSMSTTTAAAAAVSFNNSTPINFHIVHTLQQFKSIITHESYKNQVIVVRFFAPWCKVRIYIVFSYKREIRFYICLFIHM